MGDLQIVVAGGWWLVAGGWWLAGGPGPASKGSLVRRRESSETWRYDVDRPLEKIAARRLILIQYWSTHARTHAPTCTWDVTDSSKVAEWVLMHLCLQLGSNQEEEQVDRTGLDWTGTR
ncbi:hypothetical protein WAI453_001600 [Rhynchosporium graminicola]